MDHSVPVQPGDVIAGKYQIEKVIGRGGMGVVVVASHVDLRQKVAIKFLLPEACLSGVAVERFMREARASVQLGGEHVVRVSDVGRLDNGAPYMVMELLSGEDLSSVIETQGALPVEYAVDLMLQACLGLAQAHKLGIVHRDLKPANLFLTHASDGSATLKVLDFGISKAVTANEGQANLTGTSHLVGSPAYMSPEQIRDSKRVDLRTDIWSMGVILYELLMGRQPFNAETLPGMLAQVIESPPEPPLSTRADLPAALSSAVERCLDKVPDRRFQNVAELALHLAPFATPQGAWLAERTARVLGVASSKPVTAHTVDHPLVAAATTPAATTPAATTPAATTPAATTPAATTPAATTPDPHTAGAWGKSADTGVRPEAPQRRHGTLALAVGAIVAVALGGAALWRHRASGATLAETPSAAVTPPAAITPPVAATTPRSDAPRAPLVDSAPTPSVAASSVTSATASGEPSAPPARVERRSPNPRSAPERKRDVTERAAPAPEPEAPRTVAASSSTAAPKVPPRTPTPSQKLGY